MSFLNNSSINIYLITGDCVETQAFRNAEEAIDYAISKTGDTTSKNIMFVDIIIMGETCLVSESGDKRVTVKRITLR